MIVAIYPGRFQPFGPHHRKAYEWLKNKFGEETYIVTSGKTDSVKSPLEFKEKKIVMVKNGISSDKIVKVKSPYRSEELLSRFDPKKTKVVFMYGKKDAGRISYTKKDGTPGYFQKFESEDKMLPFEKHAYIVVAPHISLTLPNGKEISGTTLREFIPQSTKEEFKEFYGWYDSNVHKMLIKKFKKLHEGKILWENYISNLIGLDYSNLGLNVKDKRKILNEGGAFGHLNHPFEQKDFTFKDLQDLITQTLNGEINIKGNVQEKLDGQNLMVTVINGQVLAARNMSTVKNPMTIDQIAQKFAGRGNIEIAFTNAMKDLQKAFDKVNKNTLDKIFINGKRFLNIEVIFPDTQNVIDYGDDAYLVLLGVVEFDENFKPAKNLPQLANSLESVIEKVNAQQQEKYKIISSKIIKIKKHFDSRNQINYFVNKLNEIKNSAQLSDNDTIYDYYKFHIKNIINERFPVDENLKEVLIQRWVYNNKSTRLTKKNFGRHFNNVRDFERNELKSTLKQIKWPIEKLFLQLGIEVMKNVENFLSLSPDKSVQAIRDELQTIIDTMKNTKDLNLLEKFEENLKKFEALGGFDSIIPSEGIVFNYKGKLLKFTGSYAPINQLLGLFRYSR